jgi:hypothetical protein
MPWRVASARLPTVKQQPIPFGHAGIEFRVRIALVVLLVEFRLLIDHLVVESVMHHRWLGWIELHHGTPLSHPDPSLPPWTTLPALVGQLDAGFQALAFNSLNFTAHCLG